jgi:YbbR domain-containing protein
MMKWLWENFWLKVVAFVMGLLIWIHVATEKTYNYELSLPVTEITLKDNLSLSKEPLDSLLVAVSGTGKQLLRRAWREQGIRINASQYQAGRYSMSLSTSNTFFAHQTAVVSLDEVVSPRMIQLEIDVEGSAEVAIEAVLDLVADEGFAVGHDILISPPKARLIGPRSQLGRVDTLFTVNKTLSGLRNDVTLTLPLVPPDGYGFRLQPDSVTVVIPVVPAKTRVYQNLSVAVVNAPPSAVLAVEPELVDVEITGPPMEIDQLPVGALTVSVDFQHASSSGRAVVKVDYPPGFRLKKTSTDSVLIRVLSSADTRY